METQNLVISFDYSWFLAKNLAFKDSYSLLGEKKIFTSMHVRRGLNTATSFHLESDSTYDNIWRQGAVSNIDLDGFFVLQQVSFQLKTLRHDGRFDGCDLLLLPSR